MADDLDELYLDRRRREFDEAVEHVAILLDLVAECPVCFSAYWKRSTRFDELNHDERAEILRRLREGRV